MPTIAKLRYLLDNNAPQWRIELAARCVIMKILLTAPVDDYSKHLLKVWE